MLKDVVLYMAFIPQHLPRCSQRKGVSHGRGFVRGKQRPNTNLHFQGSNLQFSFSAFREKPSKKPEKPRKQRFLCRFVQNRDFG